MKFSVNFNSKHKAEADEVRCPVNQLGRLLPFVKEYPEKRYLIMTKSSNDEQVPLSKIYEQADIFDSLKASYTIQSDNIEEVLALIDSGFNAFLKFPVVDWETFQNLYDIGVSDIYIDGPLGFQTNLLTKRKKERFSPLKLRLAPSISPNGALAHVTRADTFFVRPEDLYLYEEAFDIVDFQVKNQDKEDTLYQIYKRGTFDFDLSQLIENLHIKVPNIMINEEFGKTRANCGQRCMIPGRSCHFCETNLKLTNTLVQYMEKKNNEKMD